MVKLYLVRHAEAEGNLYRRVHGAYDDALTELGRRQLEALDRRFQDIPLDAVYASGLSRAMETAAVLCRRKNLPLRIDPRLREAGVGIWEDVPFGTAAESDPEQMNYFTNDPIHWKIAGADRFEDVAERVIAALADIAQKHEGQTVAVCSHGFAIRSALCGLFYGMDEPELCGYSRNTAVTLLTWENGKFSLEYQYDTSHLDESLLRVRKNPIDLSIRPMGSDAAEEYIRYRTDAWQVVYGSLRGFDGGGFWLDAQRTIGPDPEAMVVGYDGTAPAGMIQLNPSRGADKGAGYIPFLYLREKYRGQGLGIQLIGHAVSFYRRQGRTKLQLSVAQTNAPALRFYNRCGFRQIRKQRGRFGALLLMEKDIAPPGKPENIAVLPV